MWIDINTSLPAGGEVLQDPSDEGEFGLSSPWSYRE